MAAGNDPQAHHHADHKALVSTVGPGSWWGFACFGDAESTFGNYSARIGLTGIGLHVVALRVPKFLRHLSAGAEWVDIPVSGFVHNRVSWRARRARTPLA
ncbi:MAG: hypothetical protein ACRDWW_07555 [Acidimicrobiales bacterium]